MIQKLDISPTAAESIHELMKLGSRVVSICENLSITPLVYGSLGYLCYTNDESISIGDLDLLVPESSFAALFASLSKETDLTIKQQPYHSIEVFSGDLEVDLDSVEHFLREESLDCQLFQVRDLQLKILNVHSLVSLYENGLAAMIGVKGLEKKTKSCEYKLNNLRKMIAEMV